MSPKDKDKEKKEKKPKAAPKKAVVSDAKVTDAKKTVKKKREGVSGAPRAFIPAPAVHEEPVVRAEPAIGAEGDMEDMPSDFGPGDGDMRPERYWEAVGRRKTAIARVRLFTRGDKGIFINDKAYGIYFPYPELQVIVEDALKKMKSIERFRVTVKVLGGGVHSQAEAVRHGIARALVKFNPAFRKRLRRAGYMTRDPRAKERKKFGLKKARRAPQWAKR